MTFEEYINESYQEICEDRGFDPSEDFGERVEDVSDYIGLAGVFEAGVKSQQLESIKVNALFVDARKEIAELKDQWDQDQQEITALRQIIRSFVNSEGYIPREVSHLYDHYFKED